MTVKVEICTIATADVVEAFKRLIPQLSSSSPAPTALTLQALIDHEACRLLVASDDSNQILGSLTLVVFPIPTATRAWIEDVVVDNAARGQGVGELLTQTALEFARADGAKTVELTSRPSRESANRLYRRLGFVERETNVYRHTLTNE